MYSGVPKAGAPDFMSTFEVKVPIATGHPGAIHCSSAMGGQPLGETEGHGTGQRHRRHGAGQGEGRDDHGLAPTRKPHGPVQHRPGHVSAG